MTLRYLEKLLIRDERPQSIYEFYVTGNGDFPVDMLRFGQCWPADGDSAAGIGYSMTTIPRHTRSIKLRSYEVPNLERWASFLWSVGKERL